MREDDKAWGCRGGVWAFRVAVGAAVVGWSLMFVAAVVIVLDLVR